jgi:hypothetical protein
VVGEQGVQADIGAGAAGEQAQREERKKISHEQWN